MNRHGGHTGHVTLRVCTNFYSLSPRRLYKKFSYIWPSGVQEELTFKDFSFSTMDGHLVYRSVTILAILVESHLGNIPMKFESHWPVGSGGVSF